MYGERQETQPGRVAPHISAFDAGDARQLAVQRMVNDANTMLLAATERRGVCDELCRVVSAAGPFSMTWIVVANRDAPFERRHVSCCRRETVAKYSESFRRHLLLLARGDENDKALICNTIDGVQPAHLRWLDEALIAGHRGFAALPLVNGTDEPLGQLLVFAGQPGCFDPETVAALGQLARNIAVVLSRLPLDVGQTRCAFSCGNAHDQMQALLDHMRTVREDERALISRELHDELGQTLSSIKIEAARLEAHLEREPGQLGASARRIATLLDGAFDELHRIVAAARPRLLDDGGLGPAIEWLAGDFAQRTGVACDVEIDIDETALSEAVATTAFRCVQECLTNAMRHAAASRVDVAAVQGGSLLTLCVADDGRGFVERSAESHGRFGLVGLRQRVESINGQMTMHSEHARGTRIEISLPLFPTGRLDAAPCRQYVQGAPIAIDTGKAAA